MVCCFHDSLPGSQQSVCAINTIEQIKTWLFVTSLNEITVSGKAVFSVRGVHTLQTRTRARARSKESIKHSQDASIIPRQEEAWKVYQECAVWIKTERWDLIFFRALVERPVGNKCMNANKYCSPNLQLSLENTSKPRIQYSWLIRANVSNTF